MNSRHVLTVIAAAVLAACTTVSPEDFAPLTQARSAYQAAAADPAVSKHAQLELQRAERELRLAEAAQKETRDTSLWEHHAYLALRASQLATETASLRTAEAEVARADADRKQLLLTAREREADTARAQAEQSRTQADQSRARESATAQDAQAKVQEAERRAAELQARVQSLQSDLQDAKTQQTERGTVVTFSGDLLFDSGQSSLKPGAQRAMIKLAEVMKEDPQRVIVVEGFTDSMGSDEMNQALSERRALAVKQALVQQGADARRIETRGYGEAYPVAGNDSPTGRQLNRRVEVVFGSEGKAVQERARGAK